MKKLIMLDEEEWVEEEEKMGLVIDENSESKSEKDLSNVKIGKFIAKCMDILAFPIYVEVFQEVELDKENIYALYQKCLDEYYRTEDTIPDDINFVKKLITFVYIKIESEARKCLLELQLETIKHSSIIHKECKKIGRRGSI